MYIPFAVSLPPPGLSWEWIRLLYLHLVLFENVEYPVNRKLHLNLFFIARRAATHDGGQRWSNNGHARWSVSRQVSVMSWCIGFNLWRIECGWCSANDLTFLHECNDSYICLVLFNTKTAINLLFRRSFFFFFVTCLLLLSNVVVQLPFLVFLFIYPNFFHCTPFSMPVNPYRTNVENRVSS